MLVRVVGIPEDVPEAVIRIEASLQREELSGARISPVELSRGRVRLVR
jgi:hypothetical protein